MLNNLLTETQTQTLSADNLSKNRMVTSCPVCHAPKVVETTNGLYLEQQKILKQLQTIRNEQTLSTEH